MLRKPRLERRGGEASPARITDQACGACVRQAGKPRQRGDEERALSAGQRPQEQRHRQRAAQAQHVDEARQLGLGTVGGDRRKSGVAPGPRLCDSSGKRVATQRRPTIAISASRAAGRSAREASARRTSASSPNRSNSLRSVPWLRAAFGFRSASARRRASHLGEGADRTRAKERSPGEGALRQGVSGRDCVNKFGVGQQRRTSEQRRGDFRRSLASATTSARGARREPAKASAKARRTSTCRSSSSAAIAAEHGDAGPRSGRIKISAGERARRRRPIGRVGPLRRGRKSRRSVGHDWRSGRSRDILRLPGCGIIDQG